MTLSGMTPAEQVAALNLAVGDTIEGEKAEFGHKTSYRYKLAGWIDGGPVYNVEIRFHRKPSDDWFKQGRTSGRSQLPDCDWRKISSDPSLDPLTPLREEMREAYRLLSWFRDLSRGCMTTHEIQPVIEWLTRNATFGPGKGEHE